MERLVAIQSADERAHHHRCDVIDDVRVARGGCCIVEATTCVQVTDDEITSAYIAVWARCGAVETANQQLRGWSGTQRREGAMRTQRRGDVREMIHRGLAADGRRDVVSVRLATILGV
jgi:hypothetical protein